MGQTSPPPTERAVRESVGPVLASLGLDLEDLEIQSSGRRRRVCIVVDRDGGIDLDGIAGASRAVSEALDAANAMGDAAYTLEVTSPGVDRPLTLPRHWRRNIGRRVIVSTAVATPVEGRILHVDDDGVVLAIDAPGHPEGEQRRVPWPEVDRGVVQVEFRRPGTEEG